MSVSIIAPYDISLASGLEFYPSAGSPLLTRMVGDSYTKLLLHCDGTDGSTTFIDETGKTVTAGNAQISTARSKFGGASGLFGGLGYLSIPSSTDFDCGAGAFTIDFWVYMVNQSGSQCFYARSVNDGLDPGAQDDYYTYFHGGTGTLRVGGGDNGEWNTGLTFSAAAWHHIEIGWNGTSTEYAFVDGVGTSKSTTYYRNGTGATFRIAHSLNINFLNGNIDEFRFSGGIIRHTANFTPLTSEHLGSYPTNSPAATHKFNIPGNNIADIADCLNYLENSLGGTGSLSYGYQLNGGSLVSGQTLAQLKAAVRNATIMVHTDSLIVYVSHVSNGLQQVESAYKIGGGLHVVDPTGGTGGKYDKFAKYGHRRIGG